MPNKILLISGLHPNEAAAPLVAEKVYAYLLERGEAADLFRIPYEYTLLANLDDAPNAVPDYCMPAGGGDMDVDLDGLVGDEAIRDRFPDHIAFEFHSARDVWKKFGIDPNKPVEEFEIGPVMPVFTRPYEIGTWRNVLHDGSPGKYVIEVPAVSMPVAPEKVSARMQKLGELRHRGYRLDEKCVDCYFMHEMDIPATEARGLIGDCIVGKIGDWIVSCVRGTSPRSCTKDRRQAPRA